MGGWPSSQKSHHGADTQNRDISLKGLDVDAPKTGVGGGVDLHLEGDGLGGLLASAHLLACAWELFAQAQGHQVIVHAQLRQQGASLPLGTLNKCAGGFDA